MIVLIDGYVYETKEVAPGVTEKILVGGLTIERIEGNEKVTLKFDEELCEYVEFSREPYIPSPQEPDPITQLQLAVAELAESQEQTIADIQLALAELAEMISGGGN